MTNAELIAILQRFPPGGTVQIRRASEKTASPADRAEMVIDASPLELKPQNLGWAELVQEKIGVVLVYGEPKSVMTGEGRG